MRTRQFAIRLIGGIALLWALFLVVPPLLNARDGFLNAIGASICLTVATVGILIAHHRYVNPK